MQNFQYENRNKQMDSTRKTRHDFRYHIMVIDDYLAKGEYDELHEYLLEFKKIIPSDHTVVFYLHAALNILFLYCAQLAKG